MPNTPAHTIVVKCHEVIKQKDRESLFSKTVMTQMMFDS